MEHTHAIAALGALAQDTRLKVFRLLVENGAHGLPASRISEAIGVRQNLMSAHLRVLGDAGLTTARREGRQIFHAVDFQAVECLLTFLLSDCCRGEAETCATLVRAILPDCCAGAPEINQ